MRESILMLLILVVAGSAYAADPYLSPVSGPVELPELQRDEFYCQPPMDPLLILNAMSGRGTEAVDDIPVNLQGHWIYDIVVYVGEWNAVWQDPDGIFVNFYDATCPPGQTPYMSRYFTWGNPAEMETELVHDEPGYLTCYRVTLWVCPPVFIEGTMSLGFQVDNAWGDQAPDCGVALTNYEVFGCGEGYWDGTIWGFPRWTLISEIAGDPIDIAYCLSEDEGPSAADESTWGAIKTLYR
ncbi:MAG: hypothetical protein KAW17_12415, partial [Candidatus Eisenbacteria sp.]|nr:hypothetical protein [Candidatus Eisenbacteria bacterium]